MHTYSIFNSSIVAMNFPLSQLGPTNSLVDVLVFFHIQVSTEYASGVYILQ